MKNFILGVVTTVAAIFITLVAIIVYEVNHIPQAYTCEKIDV